MGFDMDNHIEFTSNVKKEFNNDVSSGFDMDCTRDLNKKTQFDVDSGFGFDFNRDLNIAFFCYRDAYSHSNNEFTIDFNNDLNKDFKFDLYGEFDRDILTFVLMDGGLNPRTKGLE